MLNDAPLVLDPEHPLNVRPWPLLAWRDRNNRLVVARGTVVTDANNVLRGVTRFGLGETRANYSGGADKINGDEAFGAFSSGNLRYTAIGLISAGSNLNAGNWWNSASFNAAVPRIATTADDFFTLRVRQAYGGSYFDVSSAPGTLVAGRRHAWACIVDWTRPLIGLAVDGSLWTVQPTGNAWYSSAYPHNYIDTIGYSGTTPERWWSLCGHSNLVADFEAARAWTADPAGLWWAPSTARIFLAAATGGISLTVADAAVGPTAQEIAITQVHGLAGTDATAAALAELPGLTQEHDVSVGASSVAAAADTGALTQEHQLSATVATSAPAADTAVLTQTHLLSVMDATASASADLVTLPTAGEIDLVIAAASASAAVDAPAISQVQMLTGEAATASSAVDLAAVSQVHLLGAASTAAAASADAPAITQQHTLIVSPPHVEPEVDPVVLLQIHALTVEDALAAGLADAVAWYEAALGAITDPGLVVVSPLRAFARTTPTRSIERLH